MEEINIKYIRKMESVLNKLEKQLSYDKPSICMLKSIIANWTIYKENHIQPEIFQSFLSEWFNQFYKDFIIRK